MNNRVEQLRDDLRLAERTKEFLKSLDWAEVVEPLIDRMIVDTLGGKEDGRWLASPPKLNERTIDKEEFKFLLGYKASLIDLHQRLHYIADSYEAINTSLNEAINNNEQIGTIQRSDYE